MANFVIVLGSPNDDQGALLPIARARCDAAHREYLADPMVKIICTGGFGPAFNRTTTLHAAYLQAYLLKKGIPQPSIVGLVPSRFTIEDATLSWQRLTELALPIARVTVITSDFHVPRVRMIFSHLFTCVPLALIGVETVVDREEWQRLVAHEEMAMARDRTNLNRLIE